MAVAYFQFHAPRALAGRERRPAWVLFCFVWLYLSAAGAGPWSLDALRGKGNAPGALKLPRADSVSSATNSRRCAHGRSRLSPARSVLLDRAGTSDPKAAKDFYTKLFGWTFTDNDMGPDRRTRSSS